MLNLSGILLDTQMAMVFPAPERVLKIRKEAHNTSTSHVPSLFAGFNDTMSLTSP